VDNTLRIDSHQHFWQLSRGDYEWLKSESISIRRDFLPNDLLPLLLTAGVDKTILVHAAETVSETDFILSLASKHDFIAGVVGWVDMNMPTSLTILRLFSQHPKFLGIRPVIQGIADPSWMLKPELDPFFRWLIEHDFSFDALVKPIHLNYLHILLLRYPALRVVIDHGAKPNIAKGDYTEWAENIGEIADNTSAYCKLSGLATEAGNFLSLQKLQPYMTHLVDCFGTRRLMWGSDWPVCNLALSYQNWVDMTHEFLKVFSCEDQAAILGGNAHIFYKLNTNRAKNTV
jgi:L-fuconolactonase